MELKWGPGLRQRSFSEVPSLLKARHEAILVLGERELYRDTPLPLSLRHPHPQEAGI